MKSEVKKLDNSQVEVTITISYEAYKKAEKSAIEELSKEIKVDGFRPGHVSEDVVRKHVDENTIASVTLEKLIPPTYTEAVKEHGLQVVARPTVDLKSPIKKEGDELVYTAVVDVMPDVKIGDYKKIKVAMPKAEVKKKQVDETINMIMGRFATWKDVKRKVKNGDRVEISFDGFDEKGEVIPNTASKNHPLVLGSNSMVPGFEEAIIGLEIGKEKEFTITFPADYHAKNMQGKKVTFKLTVGRIEEKEDQKLDEAMIEKISGKKQSVEDFKKRVEKDLLAEVNSRNKRDHDNAVVKEIIKITKVDLPKSLVSDEISQMLEDQKSRIKQQGLDWDQYLQHIKKTEDDFRKEHEQSAKDRLLARFGVTTIIKEANIKATEEETDAKVAEMIAKYPEEQKAQVVEFYKKGSDNYKNLKNNLAADKLIKMLTK